jgi:hypothetical protein
MSDERGRVQGYADVSAAVFLREYSVLDPGFGPLP